MDTVLRISSSKTDTKGCVERPSLKELTPGSEAVGVGRGHFRLDLPERFFKWLGFQLDLKGWAGFGNHLEQGPLSPDTAEAPQGQSLHLLLPSSLPLCTVNYTSWMQKMSSSFLRASPSAQQMRVGLKELHAAAPWLGYVSTTGSGSNQTSYGGIHQGCALMFPWHKPETLPSPRPGLRKDTWMWRAKAEPPPEETSAGGLSRTHSEGTEGQGHPGKAPGFAACTAVAPYALWDPAPPNFG